MIFNEGAIQGVVCRPLGCHEDRRGWLIEAYRLDELAEELHPQMAYVSQTLPGVTRGPHEHVDQTDYMAFVGPGNLELYLWDARPGSPTYLNRTKLLVGEASRQVVVIPPGVVHAYKVVGGQPAFVMNFPNRLYAGEGKNSAVDEIRHEERPDCEYLLD